MNNLQKRFVGTCPGSVDQRVTGAAAGPVFTVYLHRASDEQLFERFPELPGHAAVNGEVDRVADDDEEIGEQHQQIGHRIVEYFFDTA